MKSILSAVIGATLALSAIEADAQATPGERQVSLTIETDTLASALDKWAQQSGFQIFVQDWEAAKSLPAKSLKGTFTAQDALEQLLSGTSLTYIWISDKAVSIRKKTAKTVPTALQRTSLDGQQAVPVAKFSGDDAGAGAAPYPAEESGRNSGDDQASPRVQRLEEVLVTGTYIRGVPPDSSPLTVYDREEIVRSGVGTVDQFLRKVPQNFAIVDGATSEGNLNNSESGKNMSRGTAINLRGLGPGATLTLLNGHRLAPSGLDGSFVDVSMIPLSAIERIEVLTDGASALYGADAVAGVVNFILRDDLSGAETGLRYGDTTQGGGTERAITQLFGHSWDTGNGMLLYENYDVDSIRAADRDFIDQTGGADTVLPDQERQTFMLSGRQYLGERTSVFADASYSERDYVFDSAGLIPTHNTGGSEQRVAALGLTQALGASWHADIVANYARTDDNQTTILLGTGDPPSEFAVRSELSSADVRVDGAIFEAWGGTARLSAGIGARNEKFDDNNRAIPSAGVGLKRTARSAYGELYIPLIGSTNPSRGAQRLELSLAGRYDDYDDVGSSVDPKVGVLWSPGGGVNLRATYAESYRVPPLAQLSPLNKLYVAFPLDDSQSPSGSTNTLILFAPGNPDLQPERSRSFTAGLDFRPQGSADSSISLNYFRVEYRGQIANPPASGIDFLVPELANFTDRAPDAAEIQRIFDEEVVVNPFGLTPQDVQATFDNRLQNIAKSTVEGFDLSSNIEFDLTVGRAGLFFSGAYLLKLEHRTASTLAPIDQVDTIFYPIDLRLHAGMSWSVGNFDTTLTVNYADGYRNNIIEPEGTVSSWTTADLQLSYTTADQGPWLVSGLTLALNVQNLTDKDPPSFVAPNDAGFLGYDPTNATPRGRFISAVLTKRW